MCTCKLMYQLHVHVHEMCQLQCNCTVHVHVHVHVHEMCHRIVQYMYTKCVNVLYSTCT